MDVVLMGRRAGARSRRDQQGAVAILVAVTSLLLFSCAALVVDLSIARDQRRQAQNAADTAALAAVDALYAQTGSMPNFAAAALAATTYAATNYGTTAAEWSACTDPDKLLTVSGVSPCISFGPNLTKPSTARVKLPVRSQNLAFARIMGFSSTPIGALAHASINTDGRIRCGVCVLGSSMTHTLQNGSLQVTGADLHFNGTVSSSSNGTASSSTQITVEGSALGSGYSPVPVTGQAPMPDPLAGVPFPSLAGTPVRVNPCTDGPGAYGARDLRNVTCTLQPGLYVVAGTSATVWDLSGNASTQLLGTGVTLYFTCGTPGAPRTCNPGEQGAKMDAGGSGQLAITAPTSGPWQGFAVVYDRNNSSDLRITGSGGVGMSGSLYLASGTIDIRGNGCSSGYDALVIAKDVTMSGNPACLRTTYDPDRNAQIPPRTVFLSR